MNSQIKISIKLLKISSLALIPLSFLAIIYVGAAGHPFGIEPVILTIIYSFVLILSHNYYQKKVQKSLIINLPIKILLIILILPIIGLLSIFIYSSFQDLIKGKTGNIELLIIMLLTFITFIGSELFVTKNLFEKNKENAR